MSATSSSQRPWPSSALPAWAPMLLLAALVLLLFRDTFAAMVAIWSRSDTFAHAFLVPPISLWLMWRLRGSLGRVPLSGSLAWVPAFAAACLLWLLGQLGGVASATQLAAVAMLVLAVPAVLGTALARRAAFPLLFLFFGVPLGDFLVDPMMVGTADFTVLALRLSGIPVYREGLQFVIPSGNWSVVEACSGVRYLIASFMVGTLFAYLNFRSPKRRLLFILISLLVPVLANWVRAYLIVLLGHTSGNTIAVGADHLIYGWVFFGVVIFIMFAIGARFADQDGAALLGAGQPAAATRAPDLRSEWAAAAVVGALLLATQAVWWQLDKSAGGAAPRLALPAEIAGGWAASDESLAAWTPNYRDPSAVATQTYRRGSEAVGVWVGFYRDQGFGRKMITSTNGLVPPGSRDWLPVQAEVRSVRIGGGVGGGAGGEAATLRAAQLRSPADPKISPHQRLLVFQVYRVGDELIESDAHAKLVLALRRLLGRGDDSAVLMFFGEISEQGAGSEALERFVGEHLSAITSAVDATSVSR